MNDAFVIEKISTNANTVLFFISDQNFTFTCYRCIKLFSIMLSVTTWAVTVVLFGNRGAVGIPSPRTREPSGGRQETVVKLLLASQRTLLYTLIIMLYARSLQL